MPPRWLWNLARWLLVGSVLSVALLTLALANGLADPPHAGPLLWEDDFKRDLARWDFSSPHWSAQAGALAADLANAPSHMSALTNNPANNFTFEVAGAQVTGEAGAAYGLVFDWHDASHYSAVLLNNNGYAEAYQLSGPQRVTWFQWGQWPHILVGADSNRVRVDVQGERLTFRINDEILAEASTARTPGQIGLLAHGTGRVVFSWARLWGERP